MLELIFFIIIFSCIIKSKKKKNNSVPTRPVESRRQTPRTQEKKLQNKPQTAKTPAKQMKNMSVQSKPEEMSTMEMLEAKAREDDREEMLEKQRQKIENKKHYGHHNYAERYIIGDAVPKGKKMVFCSYCNAENLIPMYSAAKDYNCYFCRENL